MSAAANLVTGQTDGNFATDLFLYDIAAGTTALASRVPAAPCVSASFPREISWYLIPKRAGVGIDMYIGFTSIAPKFHSSEASSVLGPTSKN